MDSCCDELRLFRGAHWGIFDIFESLVVFLLVDQEVNVSIYGYDDHIGENVDCANEVQDIGVVERDSL